MKKVLAMTMLACFIFSIQNASTLFINSSYATTFLDAATVGILYTIAAALALIAAHTLPTLVTPRITPSALVILLGTIAAALYSMSVSTTPLFFAIAFVLYFVCTVCTYYCFDMIIESASIDTITGRIRGLYLTGMSFGYMMGPIIAGLLVDRYDYAGLYLAAALVVFTVIGIVAHIPAQQSSTAHTQTEALTAYRDFFKNKNLRGVLSINFVLQFFYAWMVIYTPIYLHEVVGIAWSTIGIMFTCMLSAFVLFQYFFGRLADKIGEKEIMIFGLLLMSVATPLMIISNSSIPLILAGILFLTRIGASAVEVSSESYFFKHINAGQNRSLSIFRSTYPVAYIIAPLVASAVLREQPIELLFFILGGILVVGALIPLAIRDTR